MKRLSHRGHKDKSKAFDGTINSKSVELVHALLELLNKQTSLEGIYRIPGDMGEVRRTKEALNQGKKVSYENMNPHTQASLLKAFLKELADPVFTAKLYPGWIAATQHKDRKILITRLLNMLPQQNLQIISTLMIHLRHISEYHASNLMTAENLAIVFGPILLRPSSVSVETLFADVPYVNKCIGMLINDCSFFFKNKLVLLHRQTKQTSLFEEMRRAGAELIIEERKRREKEEKRLKEEQRKSERKKKYNTYSSSKRQTVKALLDTEFDPAIDEHGNVDHHPSTSPAPDPSSPSSARNKGNGSCSPDMGARLAVRPQTSYNPASAPMLPTPSISPRPPLPPLPENLPPPPPVSAGTLRRSVSAYNPVPAVVVGGHNGAGGTNSPRAISPRSRPMRPVGIIMTPPAGPASPDVPRSNGHHHHHHNQPLEYDAKGIPVPPPPPPPLELTEEEKRRKEDDENLLHNMRRRYVDRRKQTLDRWFKRKNDWTEEEFNKAMEERAALIENGEYSPQDLQLWFAEMGAGDDEDPLNVSQSSNVSLNHQIGGRSREGSPALPSREAHHHGTPSPATTSSGAAVDTTLCVS